MPPRTTEAFVLDAAVSRERDKIVTLFTESDGKVRGVAHGAARSVKRFGGRLERLSRVKATYFEKEGADLVRIDDLELIEESFLLQQDLAISAALSYVSEVASEFVREKESDRRYFRLIAAILDAFRARAEVRMVLRYFEFWTARLHGIFPGFLECDACRSPFGAGGARVAVADGAALCSRCARGAGGRSMPLSPSALTAIDAFRREAPAALSNVVFPPAALKEIEAAATEALQSFAGREFRSRAFLAQVIAETRR
jgi:DNA repair protein RecO (recombination protein O)